MQLIKTALAGLGLVALALSAPTNTPGPTPSTSYPATLWEDTLTQKHHCVDKDVVRCKMTAGGSCLVVHSCESYYFEHNKGAMCMDTSETIERTSSDNEEVTLKAPLSKLDEVTARAASPQENKHYVCSKGRRSVLICKYGFCSTDHYCKSNEECKDRSISCESNSPSPEASKPEIRAMAARAKATPIKLVTRNRGSKKKSTFVCSKDRASVLKCTYGFCSTDYYCAKGHPCADNPARCKKAK